MTKNTLWWLLGGATVAGLGWWFLGTGRTRYGRQSAVAGPTPQGYTGGYTGGVLNTGPEFSDQDRIAAASALAAARGQVAAPSTGLPQAAAPPTRVLEPMSSGNIRIPLPGPNMTPMIRADSPLSGWRR